MNKTRWLLMGGVLACVGFSLICLADNKPGKKKILIFSQSMGFRHGVVARPLTGEMAFAEKVFKDIATKAGYEVFFSQDYHDLESPKQFAQFDAIVLYTTREPAINRDAMMKWLKAGGALIGIHSATDSFYDWPEYGQIMGGYFTGHGCNDKPVVIKVENGEHPSTRMLDKEWVIADEMYQIRDVDRGNVQMLLSMDTSRMSDETLEAHKLVKGKDYPVAYTNTLEKGRVFYTSLGHREDVWTNPVYQKHLLAGIAWALGEAK